jgi:hypothetical protein
MKNKIARLCLLAATLTAFTTLPAFAEESFAFDSTVMDQVEDGSMIFDDSAITEDQNSEIAPDDSTLNPLIPHRPYYLCVARNRTGHMFRGIGLMIRPAMTRALVNCRGHSLGLLRFTCRVTACRRAFIR